MIRSVTKSAERAMTPGGDSRRWSSEAFRAAPLRPDAPGRDRGAAGHPLRRGRGRACCPRPRAHASAPAGDPELIEAAAKLLGRGASAADLCRRWRASRPAPGTSCCSWPSCSQAPVVMSAQRQGSDLRPPLPRPEPGRRAGAATEGRRRPRRRHPLPRQPRASRGRSNPGTNDRSDSTSTPRRSAATSRRRRDRRPTPRPGWPR